MRRWQKRLFAVLFCVGVALHATSLFTGNQYWPVAGYTVLATKMDDSFGCFVPYAVPADPSAPDFRVWDPQLDMGYHTLRFSLLKIMEYPWRNAQYATYARKCQNDDACVSKLLAQDALAYLYTQYETVRTGGGKQPVLRGMRLYHVDYTPQGSGYAIQRDLVAEWKVP